MRGAVPGGCGGAEDSSSWWLEEEALRQRLDDGLMTVAWLDDGRMTIRSDDRRGSHGMHYLKQRWFGFSILARATEHLASSTGSAGLF